LPQNRASKISFITLYLEKSFNFKKLNHHRTSTNELMNLVQSLKFLLAI